MITGNIQYVVIDRDEHKNIVAVWGPFPNQEEATRWEGLPGGPCGEYLVLPLRSAPQWFEGYTHETEDESTEDGS